MTPVPVGETVPGPPRMPMVVMDKATSRQACVPHIMSASPTLREVVMTMGSVIPG